MSKNDLQSASIEDFFYWINERHRIYVNRFDLKLPKPWTDDPIFQTYKFTNVFRQLDSGTIALNKMLGKWHKNPISLHDMDVDDAVDILFNVVWYRLFNWEEHAVTPGWTSHKDYDFVKKVLIEKRKMGMKIFTGAHMTSGGGKHGKFYGHLIGPTGIATEFGERYISYIYHHQTMLHVTTLLRNIPMVGPFIAYEIACDLRFTPLLSTATDVLTWANLGPGAKRGLLRLGMEPTNASMVELYRLSLDEEMVEYHVAEHFPFHEAWDPYPPFELREIEHSLCEFDKYMRVKTGAGRPRQKYDGGV